MICDRTMERCDATVPSPAIAGAVDRHGKDALAGPGRNCVQDPIKPYSTLGSRSIDLTHVSSATMQAQSPGRLPKIVAEYPGRTNDL
jgi:hypothetical protein